VLKIKIKSIEFQNKYQLPQVNGGTGFTSGVHFWNMKVVFGPLDAGIHFGKGFKDNFSNIFNTDDIVGTMLLGINMVAELVLLHYHMMLHSIVMFSLIKIQNLHIMQLSLVMKFLRHTVSFVI
jgi:hypothetical protein